jgi:putative drug exporter of the RND superfamily
MNMAKHLYRLGGWAFDNRWKVLGGWLVVLVAVVMCAAAFAGETNDEFTVPGTESQEAQDLLEERFPAASGATARMVFEAPQGQTFADPEVQGAVEESLSAAANGEDVTSVTNPFEDGTISENGQIAFADVVYPVPAAEISDTAKDDLEASAEPAEAAGLKVDFGGGIVTDESETSSEALGIIVAFLVLSITLGSLLAAGMPIGTAILGVALGLIALSALTDVIKVSETAPILATMLGLAVGIDYALFIISRHREDLDEGQEPREAAATASATAGSAVVFAGATVVIALVGLLVVNIPFLTVMGMAAAGTVAIAVLIALTLIPALLGFAGDRIVRRNRVVARVTSRSEGREKMSVKWARAVTSRPRPVVAVGLVVMLVAALPALDIKLGLPDGGSQPEASTERRAYDRLTEGFGEGFNATLTAVVNAPDLSREDQLALAEDLARGLENFPGVAAVSPPAQNFTHDLTIVQVIPTSSPTSDETKDLVEALRARADEVRAETGIEAFVTGTTALNIDTADSLNAALPRYILVVVGLALILLTIVFRSIWVPVKAAAGFLLTIAAALGVVVWIFQQGNLADLLAVSLPGPIISFLPILLIGILFGLAMDYEVFLVSRMREAYVRSGQARESIVTGFGESGRVVTAAAIIMTSVFGAFVLADDPVTKSIGLSLAVGVLADAFIVRMTLVPAVMALLGDRAWWLPTWLDRRLPNLDIEGESLHRDVPEPEAPPVPEPVGEPVEPGAEEPVRVRRSGPG